MSDDLLAMIRRLLDAADPGPWRQTSATPWGSAVICAESGEMFSGVSATTTQPSGGWSPEAHARAREVGQRKCANAALIAAAPTLLAECVSMIELLIERSDGGWSKGYSEGWTEAMDHVRRATTAS